MNRASVPKREYPEQPLVGVGGVVMIDNRALLVRRGNEPLRGEWSIPGGLLEIGETLTEGVAREIREETGLSVRVLELIAAVDRIFADSPPESPAAEESRRGPRYHYVILDYLCEVLEGEPRIGDDVTEMAYVREEELERYRLGPLTTNVLHKAFAMARARAAG
jgi:8-oxo-dGTP diphosphatase